MDALCKCCGVLYIEATLDKSRLEQQGRDVLDIKVLCVVIQLGGEVLDDAAVGVKLECLLSSHNAAEGVVSQSLVLHDLAHCGGPAPLRGNEDARRVYETVTSDADALDLISEYLLHVLAELCKALFLLFLLLLLVFCEFEIDSVLGYALQLLALELFERRGHVLIDGFVHKQYFDALLVEPLKERRLL